MRSFLLRNKQVIGYGLSLAVLLFLLKWLEVRFIIVDHAMEFYILSIALLFTALGIWLAMKLSKPRSETVIVEKEVVIDRSAPFVLNEKALKELALSERELEVLQLMATGASNQEIAERLFLSLNTVKTHAARLFEKMDVKRRTQAIEKAKRLQIIE